MPSILINGCKTDQISILDRGFQYGDGVFETIRIEEAAPQYWYEHMNRLAKGCRRLNILIPESSVFLAEAESLCGESKNGVLKIIVTRGTGERGYAYTQSTAESMAEPLAEIRAKPDSSTRVLAIYPPTQYPEEYRSKGVTIRVCETRLGINPALAGLKHLNRLEQVIARAEWNSPEIHEGLMMDTNNNIIEGIMSNLFCVKNNRLYTPELSGCGVKGIMREQVINEANRTGIPVNETDLGLNFLYQSDELFLCNSLIGIWPVRQLENHEFNVGPISRQLGKSLHFTENHRERGAEDVA